MHAIATPRAPAISRPATTSRAPATSHAAAIWRAAATSRTAAIWRAAVDSRAAAATRWLRTAHATAATAATDAAAAVPTTATAPSATILRAATALALLTFAGVLPAQDVTLLGQLKSRPNLAGLWGYRAPDGTELALAGEWNGLWIVDATDPAQPKEVAYFPAPPSPWREVTVHGKYAYAVSEGHAGLQVIDLSVPLQPKDLGWVHETIWPAAHTISVDPDQGRLYVNGTRLGMFILDAAADPLRPPLLGLYTGDYVHDSHVRRGRAYLSESNRGNLRIVDVGDPARPRTVSITPTPGRFTHNAWVTDDDALLATTDENPTGFLQLWDLAGGSPVALGQYVVPGHVVHNVQLIGRAAYLSHYTDGFHLVDLADPRMPRLLARYDTSTAAQGLRGAWGCYPFQDSGVVYVSDTDEGLLFLQVDCGHLNRYGNATPGAAGRTPRLRFSGATPVKGTRRLRLELDGLAPHAGFLLLVSLQPDSTTLLGVELLVQLAQALFVHGTADGSGQASVPLPIPNNNYVATHRIHLQLLALDPGAPLGVAASRGAWFGICK